MTPSKPRVSPLLVLGLGVLGISTGSIWVRLAQGQQVPSLVIAAWRLTLASAVLWPWAWQRRRAELRGMERGDWGLVLLSGGMLALHFASWITSLAYTSVASSTVLVTTSPLWVGLAAPLLLGERLTRPLKSGMALAMVGSVLIGLADSVGWENGRLLFSLNQSATYANPLWGNALALLGAIAASFYLIIGRRLRQKLSLLSYTATVYGTAALLLLLVVGLGPLSLFGYPPLAFFFLAMMALFPQLLGHSSYNWALGYLSAAYVSIAVIAEPIGATILAFLLFGEQPGSLTLLGSGFILLGIVWSGRRESA